MVGVEAHLARRVADLADDLADDGRVVDHRLARDLAGQADQAGRQQALARDAGVRVLRQQGIENAVGDLIGHLVGMTHRDRFAREQVTVVLRHGVLLLKPLRGVGGGGLASIAAQGSTILPAVRLPSLTSEDGTCKGESASTRRRKR